MTGLDHDTSSQRLDLYAQDFPDQVAFVDSHDRISWSILARRSRQFAHALLKLGLRKGDVVLSQVPNNIQAIVIRQALNRAGLVGAPIPMQWRNSEIAAACGKAKAAAAIVAIGFKGFDLVGTFEDIKSSQSHLKHILTLGENPDRVHLRTEDLMESDADGDATAPPTALSTSGFSSDEVSWLLCSSGSTGLPKLIGWKERAQRLTAYVGAHDMALGEDDVVGVFAPLSGYAGLYASLWSLSCRVRTVLADDLNPEHLFRMIERERITVISLVPPVLVRMLQANIAQDFDLSSLRAVRVGTAQFPPAMRRRTEEVFDCVVLAAAGCMEAGVFAQCRSTDSSALRLSESVGTPPTGTQCAVVDAEGTEVPPGILGELVVKSEIGACGYHEDPEATAAAWNGPGRTGWYHTGDLAVMAATGALTLVGRKNTVINRGGNKVLPLEVERALMQHAEVSNCIVLGVPDGTMGTVPCAWVIRRPGTSIDEAQANAFLRESGFATYKVPAYFLFVDELPMLGNGKIDSRRLLDEFVARLT